MSSAVKVYLKYPDEFENLISDLLTVATENVSNPDVRDRAFIYWRMLSTDPEKTKNVVFGYRPQAKDTDKLVDQSFLSEIMKSMGYVSSLFEKKPEELFQKSLDEQKVLLLSFRVSKYNRKKNKLLHQFNRFLRNRSRLLLLNNHSHINSHSSHLLSLLPSPRNRKKTICLICCENSIKNGIILY